MNKQNTQFCFCTLAVGSKYRKLAVLLAQDIDKYSSGTSLIIATDKPEDFSDYPQVLAFKYKMQGVKYYHDKRFAIAKALSLFNACIFLDCDMRIVEEVPKEMAWLLEPGISARTCRTMAKKFANVADQKTPESLIQEFILSKKVAQAWHLAAGWLNILFVHEYLFSVTQGSGEEIKEFLRLWDNLANYYETNDCHGGEGNAISLAATKAGIPIRWSNMPGISFFNNKIEMIRIQKGESSMEEKSEYFKAHDTILFSQQPINSFIDKLNRKFKLQFLYRKFWFRINNLLSGKISVAQLNNLPTTIKLAKYAQNKLESNQSKPIEKIPC